MSTSSIERLKHLFDRLVELPPEQRDAWLAQQADMHQTTRLQLQRLLSADAEVAEYTAVPALRNQASDPSAWLGRRIGPYEIVRELGRGGMGSVFLARRSDGTVEQQVAIKIVRPEILDAHTLARFRLERQVLALLQHPNIAAMLDLGELDDGSPYAIMEYVDGVQISSHAREQQLGLRARLQLFLQVCDAVAYAHGNMIVHRDLKPGNVLVDRNGRPHLLDFGIAKPLQARVGAIDVEETGAAQRFFSPAHAAPEQLREGRIGAACDVYGLGTLLYELLAGVAPFALDNRNPAQLQHDILEVDPVAPGRRPGRDLPFSVDRDLDLITLRCLRKKAEDRYASVDQLAEDIRNYLDGKPVQARRGNALYRAGRFIARHRLAVALTGVTIAVAAAGTALLWRQQLATAEQHARAEEMSSLITDAVASMDPNKSKLDLSARDVFERVAAQAKASPKLAPDSRARVLAAIARINLDLGQPQQADLLLGDIDTTLLSPQERSQVMLTRTHILQTQGKHDEAAVLIDKAKAENRTPADTAQWTLLQAESDAAQGKIDEALAKVDTIDPALLPPPVQEDRMKLRVNMLMNSADADLRATAIPELAGLLAAQKARLGENAPAAFDTMQMLIQQQVRAGKVDQAEKLGDTQLAMAETVYGRYSLRYATALSTAAMIERARKNYARAVELQQQELEIVKAQSGEISPGATKIYLNLAVALDNVGRVEESAHYYRLTTDTAPKVWPPLHVNVILFRTAHAIFLVGQNQIPEAQALARLSLADAELYPQLKDRDIYLLTMVVDHLGDWHSNPTPANREAVSKSMRFALDNAVARSTREAGQELATMIGKLGIQPAEVEKTKP